MFYSKIASSLLKNNVLRGRFILFKIKVKILIYLIIISALAESMGGIVMSNEKNFSSNDYSAWKNGPPKDVNYFPIAVWLQNPINASRYKEIGINLYVGLWKGPTKEQLKLLSESGMQVICSQNDVGLAHIDDPIIVGWMHGDEPDNAQLLTDRETGKKYYGGPVKPQLIVDDYENLRLKDPSRPILLNLGQGVANDEWHGRGSGAHIDDYLTYVKGADIVSFDVYPVVGINKPDGENYLWYVAKGVSRLVKWTEGKKIIWNCIECTRIGNKEKKATPHQVRAEVWMSLIHGSKGLIWFVHEWEPKFNEHALLDDPEMKSAVSMINHQIHELAPILNSPNVENIVTVESSDPDIPIAIMTKQYKGRTYLFSVNMRNKPAEGSFKLTHTTKSKLQVLWEDRNIDIDDSSFSDKFEPYDVHIYIIED